MTNSHEQLRHFEAPAGKGVHEAAGPGPLALEHIERMSAGRAEMLRLVENDIPPSFRDAIRAKLEYERTYVLKIAQVQQKRAERKRRQSKVLPSEFFIRTPLDADIV